MCSGQKIEQAVDEVTGATSGESRSHVMLLRWGQRNFKAGAATFLSYES